MIIRSNAIQKQSVIYSKISIQKIMLAKKIAALLIIAIGFSSVLFLTSKLFANNSYSNDIEVADFRTDLNKLWETSKVIDSLRVSKPDLNLHEFGTTGELLNVNDINQNLKRVLLKAADINGDNRLSQDEITALGIMYIDEKLYIKELKVLQYNSLSIDNNLNHYVMITKGKYTGTVLYNGPLKFIDSKNKNYFGVDLFEQL